MRFDMSDEEWALLEPLMSELERALALLYCGLRRFAPEGRILTRHKFRRCSLGRQLTINAKCCRGSCEFRDA
jgi:hypothetical protein